MSLLHIEIVRNVRTIFAYLSNSNQYIITDEKKEKDGPSKVQNICFVLKYRKFSNKTRRSYSFSKAPNVGLIRIWAFLSIVFLSLLRVLLEFGSY